MDSVNIASCGPLFVPPRVLGVCKQHPMFFFVNICYHFELLKVHK